MVADFIKCGPYVAVGDDNTPRRMYDTANSAAPMCFVTKTLPTRGHL